MDKWIKKDILFYLEQLSTGTPLTPVAEVGLEHLLTILKEDLES